jgi:hypothetical protein
MRKLLRYRGLMVIALWQAPIGTDSEGRTRLGFGFGGGQLEYERLVCGEPASYSPTSFRHVGAEVEHFASKRTRVHASAGLQMSDSSSSSGLFGAFMLSFEGKHFGIGGGGAMVPSTNEFADQDGQVRFSSATIPAPSLYLRVGNHNTVHVRAEIYPPASTSAAEAIRVVLGYNRFDSRRPSVSLGYVGILENASASMYPGLMAEWFQPVSSKAAIGLHGFTAKGTRHRNTGVSAQLKLKL